MKQRIWSMVEYTDEGEWIKRKLIEDDVIFCIKHELTRKVKFYDHKGNRPDVVLEGAFVVPAIRFLLSHSPNVWTCVCYSAADPQLELPI